MYKLQPLVAPPSHSPKNSRDEHVYAVAEEMEGSTANASLPAEVQNEVILTMVAARIVRVRVPCSVLATEDKHTLLLAYCAIRTSCVGGGWGGCRKEMENRKEKSCLDELHSLACYTMVS